MNKKGFLLLLAWLGVPIAFAGYVSLAYSWSLARGQLPFLGAHEKRWWIAFVIVLFAGTALVSLTSRQGTVRRLVLGLLYLVAMAVILFCAHLGVACGHGDCL